MRFVTACLTGLITAALIHAAVGSSAQTAPAHSADSPFGMCSNHNILTNPLYPDRMLDAGARICREDMEFKFTRPTPEEDPAKWDWARADQLVPVANAFPKLDWLVILGGSMPWAADTTLPQSAKTPLYAPSRGLDVTPAWSAGNIYGNYVYETVRRYHGIVRYWEAWNEPDLPNFAFFTGNGRDFLQIQRACYLAAKHADPDCKVLFGGLCYANVEGYLATHNLKPPTPVPARTCFFEEYLQACRQDPEAKRNNYYFDIMSQHSYSRASDLYDYTMVDRKLMRDYMGGERPIWMTETGTTDHGGAFGMDPDEYCDYVLQSYAWATLGGVEKIFHFQLDNSNGHGLYQGMLGEPKPVLTAYRDVLTKEFSDARLVAQRHGRRGVGFLEGYSPATAPHAGYDLFEFMSRDGSRRLWMAFTDTANPVTIKIPAARAHAVLVDRRNERRTIDASGGFYTVTLAGATNVAGWGVLTDKSGKPLGVPEHLVGGATVVLIENAAPAHTTAR